MATLTYVYADQTPDFPLPFTYPPFAAVAFYPLTFLPFWVVALGWQLGIMAALYGVALFASLPVTAFFVGDAEARGVGRVDFDVQDGRRELVPMRWGFSKPENPAFKPDHMHARAETIDARPTFAESFAERRGITFRQRVAALVRKVVDRKSTRLNSSH